MQKNENCYNEIQEFNISDFSFCSRHLISVIDNIINFLKNNINKLKSERSLSKQLIALANEELLASNNKDIIGLINDKTFFIGEVVRLTEDIDKQTKKLNKLSLIRERIIDFEHSLELYKNNLDKINEMIKCYNANINNDIIDYPNNYLSDIEIYKNNISSLIEKRKLLSGIISDDMINVFNGHLSDLEKIENYYNDKKNNTLKSNNNESLKIYAQSDIKSANNGNLLCTSSPKFEVEVDRFIYETKVTYIYRRPKKKKINKIRKTLNWQKIKKALKKTAKRVFASLLIGVTMLSSTQILAGDGIHFDSPSTISVLESSEANSINQEKNTKNINIDNKTAKTEKVKNANNIEYDDNNLTIGDMVDVTDNIYVSANDATNKQNSLESDYPINDERTISAIAYSKNENTDYVTVTKSNKNKIEELEQMKYDVVAYCVSNNSRSIEYEGWHNVDDVKVKVYQ